MIKPLMSMTHVFLASLKEGITPIVRKGELREKEMLCAEWKM